MISKDTAVVLGDHDRRLRNLEAAIKSLDAVIAELREDLRKHMDLGGADLMRENGQ